MGEGDARYPRADHARDGPQHVCSRGNLLDRLAVRDSGKLKEVALSNIPDLNGCRREAINLNSAQDAWDCRCLGDLVIRFGDKWTILVLAALGNEGRRFKALHREVEGISQRMLTVTLRALERDGVVVRTTYPEVPPRVEYELSHRGISLKEALTPFREWVLANTQAIQRSREVYDQHVRLSDDRWTVN